MRLRAAVPSSSCLPLHRRRARDAGPAMRGAVLCVFASLRIAALALAAGAPVALAHAGDDDELVIVDDDAAVSADGVVHFGPGAASVTPPGPAVDAGADDDDLIIIVDEVGAPLPVATKVTGPLGRV